MRDGEYDKAGGYGGTPFLSRNVSARIGVLYFFALEGMYSGFLSAYLPLIQSQMDLSDNTLGFALLFSNLGQVFATPAAGWAMRKSGSKITTSLFALLYCLTLPCIALIDNKLPALCATLLLFGTLQGGMDCSMNSAGIAAEAGAGKPILGSFHGSFSIAAAAGGWAVSAALAAGVSVLPLYTVLSAVCFLLAVLAGCYLYNKDEEKELVNGDGKDVAGGAAGDGDGDENDLHFLDGPSGVDARARPPESSSTSFLSKVLMIPQTRQMALLSALGFLGIFTEAAIMWWLLIYYDRYFPAAPASSRSFGFIFFEVSMGCGRFSVDRLRRLAGPRQLAMIGGLCACTGLSILSLAPLWTPKTGSTSTSLDVLAASFGMLLCGCGLSVIVPLTFVVAAYIGHSGTSIATVGCWMYAGGILSSPLLGAVSKATDSLQSAFAVLAACALLIIPIGFFIKDDDRFLRGEDGGGGGGGGSEKSDDDIRAPLLI